MNGPPFDQSYLESLDRLGEPIEIQERRNGHGEAGANLSPESSTPPIGKVSRSRRVNGSCQA